MNRYRIAICALLVSVLAFPAGAQQYTKVAVPDATTSLGILFVGAINHAGHVAANQITGASSSPFLWTPTGGTQFLPLPSGFVGSAYGISNNDEIVGSVNPVGGYPSAVLWTPSGGMQYLGTLTGQKGCSAFALNDAGDIAGSCGVRAFFWTPTGGMQDIGSLGGSQTGATGINNSGMVVGSSYLPSGGIHAFVWTATGGMLDLGTLNGDSYSTATAVSDLGQVVGSSSGHAFLWSASSGMQDLGTLPGGSQSWAEGVNSKGAVVGYSFTTNRGRLNEHAFLWNSTNGMQDLNLLALGTYRNGNFGQTGAINSSGQIVGEVVTGGGATNTEYVFSPRMTTTVSSSQNPSKVGQPVTFTATINSIAGPPPDGEMIEFHNNGAAILGTAPLVGGTASFTTSMLSVNTHTITAHYPGDENYAATCFNCQGKVTQIVQK